MKTWSESSMAMAVEEVNKGMSVRKSSEKYGVPKSSLHDRVGGKVEAGSTWGKDSQLSLDDETEMIKIATKRAEMGIGFSKSTFLRFVGVYAKEKGTPFKNGIPSDMWWRRLKQRHDSFSLRSAEATASSRHNAMTKKRIGLYFGELKSTYDKYGLHNYPSRIWNMDETGITMCHKPPKVIASKGAKTVHGKASISRETITVIACGNASGHKIPPHFIIPGKTTKKLHGFDTDVCRTEDSPLNGANFSVSDSGWTKDGICQLWFEKTFLSNIGEERPQILICDGHRSHNNVELLKLARDNNIILGELPSHTSHWTQPFDRSVFKSLKTSWNIHVDNFVKETGVPLTHTNFFRIFGKAWQASITQANIASGFRATGIFPFNPNAIPLSAYMPSEASTDHSLDSIVTMPVSTEASVTDENEPMQTATSDKHELYVQTSSDPVMASVGLEVSDNDLSFNSVSSVELSIPFSTCEDSIDLPVSLDLFGNLFCDNENLPNTVESNSSSPNNYETQYSNVSDDKALEVIESALSPEQLSKYCAAFLGGIEMEDKMYQTWKMYKQKCPNSEIFSATKIVNEMFPLPKSSNAGQRKRKTNSSDGFFVITADEVFNEKLAKQEEKKKRLLRRRKENKKGKVRKP